MTEPDKSDKPTADHRNDDQEQLRRYAEDLSRIFQSEKEKRGLLENANKQLSLYAEDLNLAVSELRESEKNSGSLNILGVEEMMLQISPDDTVGYVNGPMAKLLGMPDRKAALGSPTTHWDNGFIGKGLIAALVQIARTSEEPHILERAYPRLPLELLSSSAGSHPAGAPILRFSVNAQKGRVQIIAQDVTKLRWLENTFSRYVSSAIIQKMQTLPSSEFLGMERREMTVLFGDLRGFTAISQTLTPEGIQEMINSFLANMVACVDRLEGTVDKYVGDEVMVLFGAPLEQPDHALRALICATEMQKAHRAWMKERELAAKPFRPLGVGVCTGSCVVGNIGAESRMDYTALGHPVNLAARICGEAQGGEILSISATRAAAMNALKAYSGDVPIPCFSFGSKGKISLKNMAEPVEVLAVTSDG
ncbi:MAG: adenylate/guanylate cyclase domain-containing protein [Myxococcales bacterium]|nr:MAG: adenylate/guanylate cyclase domain-containing protein [Myxococcales bacterium]